MPMGRPSTYTPERAQKCKDLIAKHFANGFGLPHVARDMGCSRKTIYNWMDANPDLLHAFEAAKDVSLSWWDEAITTAAISGKGNAAMFKLQVVNKHPDDYKDRTEIDLTAEVGVFELDFTGYKDDAISED
jgi:hypothetical protein